MSEVAEQEKNLGNEEFNAKNYDQAIVHYSEAIRLAPGNHIYYSNRSAAYGAINQWEKAEQDAKECVRLNPSFKKGLLRLANAQRQLGKNDDAVATMALANGGAAPAKRPKQENAPLPASVQKELQELQPQFQTLHRELETIEAKLGAFSREKKRIQLTKEELSALPSGTHTYASIGKMFLEMTTEENVARLTTNAAKMDDQVAALEARKQYLERQKTSLETNIAELLAQCKTSA
ncbi:hypothetical protein SPRG_03906 [Saprolegnia parasitica CBS 223.65]|uniref:Uncharacterized protein n=1 Tax=Saprolegnia parasitica (strain CBS 223.65) TaxID=695850 RepID=A0A067CPX8_SAPPC|nr:hypothetical protein SPRG_03906 [Saprolegnia parasitica CBS 223.65]KDO31290.1 hypothetical protein SPRG_03906 [Saprolegnia parasitica CBS 223.65]|eukprot:XP_012197889.1 hypothetical protein SPRG_03906 [Saprolegnia parasitica CBS 223.65]